MWSSSWLSAHVVTQTSFSFSEVDSDLYYGEIDDAWSTQPLAPTWEISEVDSSGNDLFLMFPTRLQLPNGWSIVTYIRYDTSTGFDGGDVVRRLFDSTGTPSGSVEVLMTATATRGAARPHVTLVGDYLITAWDEDLGAGGLRCYMRIDQVTLS